MTIEQALAEFAAKNGRAWRRKLSDIWMNGKEHLYENATELRQARNILGSSIFRMRTPKITK